MTQVCVQSSHALLLDDEITALALQLEEIGIHEKNGKGKYPVGNPPDTKFAFNSFQAEIIAHLAFLKDLKLAHSIAHAVDRDAQAIAKLTEEQEQVQEDRRYAIRLSGEKPAEDVPSAETSTENLESIQQAFNDTGIHGIHFDEPDDEPEAGPSVTYADRQAKAFDKFSDEHQCSVCFGDYRATSMLSLPCGDQYCVDCLKTLFLNATTDETLFPPRCCRQPIPLQYIQRELSSDELNTFHNSAVEFSTKDRTYCSNVRCGKFILPTKIRGDRAECPVCFTETCTACKAAFHEGDDCPADPALQATISLAQEQGWQRCYACRAMVELDYGCNHMTCKCGAEFCYICGVNWKHCPCDQWNEERLLVRAREVVNRDAPGQLPRLELNRRVDQMRDALRENHECAHRGWLPKIEGRDGQVFRCEICVRRHRRFILQCPQCYVHICADCRRNRLR